jgi:hypothetical protein
MIATARERGEDECPSGVALSGVEERLWMCASMSVWAGMERAERMERNMWFWGRQRVPSTSKMRPLSVGAEWVLGMVGERGAKRRGLGGELVEVDMVCFVLELRV